LLKVTVLAIERGKVRLGFEAAGDIPVHRLEVWERIRGSADIDIQATLTNLKDRGNATDSNGRTQSGNQD
jgi:carbon storage regulator CsrA